MAKYKVKLSDGYEFTMLADLTQASANIGFLDEDGEPQPSPFQTASARHDAKSAAKLLVHWWKNQSSGDWGTVRSVRREKDD